MAEIEIAAFSKKCLDRRIATIEELSKEAIACAKKRNSDRIKIEWRFTTVKARKKLKRHYEIVWKVIKEDLPILKKQLVRILAEFKGEV